MRLLYLFGVRLYSVVARLLSLKSEKAAKWVSGRKAIPALLEDFHPEKEVIWLHAASLGEFEMGKLVLEQLLNKYPKRFQVVVSFFSPSGYDYCRNYSRADLVTYLPVDTPQNMRRFVNHIQPTLGLFVKYEFWYYAIQALRARKVPIIFFSARFYPGQIFFKWYGGFFRRMLQDASAIAVQRKADLDLLNEAGLRNGVLCGDTRYDRVKDIAALSEDVDWVTPLLNGKPVIIAGSTWEKEDELMLKLIERHKGAFQYIVAPHEFKEDRLQAYRSLHQVKAVFYSEWIRSRDVDPSEIDLIVVDSVGFLARLYKYGTLAFVGGGFGVGLHNILEPMSFGLPVCFGPDYTGFDEAGEALKAGVAQTITSYDEFEAWVMKVMNDPIIYKGKLKSYMSNSAGATQRTVEVIEEFI